MPYHLRQLMLRPNECSGFLCTFCADLNRCPFLEHRPTGLNQTVPFLEIRCLAIDSPPIVVREASRMPQESP